MKKRKISWPLCIGAVLILCALCLMVLFQIRASGNVRKSEATAKKIQSLLQERTRGMPEMYPDAPMPVLEIDGKDYIALLEIPAFGLTLPVADVWDRSQTSRFWGSVYAEPLVIGGTDYPRQFDFCDKIENGTTVTVTDMTGAQFTYKVARVDRAKHAETQWLTSANWDLTLFCRALYSMEYVAVRCQLTYK